MPASPDALLLDHGFLNPMVSSELAGDFTIETLCFDTGADSYTIQANLGSGTFRYLTFLGGTNALGRAEAIALSPTTTGTIDTAISASANIGDLFPIIVGAGNIAGVFANANVPAPSRGGSCYCYTASNGGVWDLNTAGTGSSPQAEVDPTVFEQTRGD